MIIVVFTIVTVFLILLVIEVSISSMKYVNELEGVVKPLSLREQDAHRRIAELTSELELKRADIQTIQGRVKHMEKTYIGSFENRAWKHADESACVLIGEDTKGGFPILVNNSLCPDFDQSGIFSYDNEQRQVRVGEQLCVDAVNQNDIVLSNCLKTSQRQKFEYYPFVDGKIKSVLYKRCIGVNKDNNIVELQDCDNDSNIVVMAADKHV
jgi:hypothetical protein